AGNRQAKRQETQLNRQRTVSSIVLRSSSSGISRAYRRPCSALGELREWQTAMCPFGIHTGGRIYVPLWDTPRRLLTRFRIVNMCPFGIRGVSLWDTGFCFFGVVEQRAVPAVEIAGRCDMFPIGVEGRTFGDPPMWGDTIAIDASAAAGHHRDEGVVLNGTSVEPIWWTWCRDRRRRRGRIGKPFHCSGCLPAGSYAERCTETARRKTIASTPAMPRSCGSAARTAGA